MQNAGRAHFSDHEIERMRTILMHHDSQKAKEQVHDLNNPPRVSYSHQAYPKAVYKGAAHQAKLVHNETEHQEALAAGFENEPFGEDDEPETVLDAASAAEAAAVDEKLAKLKAEAKAKAKAAKGK